MMLNRKVLALTCALSLASAVFPAAICAAESEDIVILFESDVHCATDGYTKLAALRNEKEKETDYVSVVSCGDFVQGGPLGAVSDGEYIIDIMNAVGYDAVTLGNHEFDYTISTLANLTDKLTAKTVSCNFVTLADGADYIVALSHLGTEYVTEEWTAQEVAAHTSGINVMLDGHSHSVIEGETVPDMNGEDVLISSVGTKFEYIGSLTIDADGEFTTELIETASYDGEDEAVSKVVSDIEAEYAAMGDRVVGTSEVTLTTLDENGNRAVRSAETNIGDFCADAFRIELGADIGIMNGGGIRADIAAGDVTYNDILAMFPYGNLVCTAQVSGQDVLDMLENSVIGCPEEEGRFLQVSGVKFNVNTSIESAVTLDENEMFTGVEGERRVSDVEILNSDTGEYEPIDVNASYTVASIEYLLKESGSGYTMFDGAEIVNNAEILDTQVIEDYIETLGGTIGEEYADVRDRINILEYIPLRATFEGMGYTVSWYSETPDCAFVTIGDTTIMFRDKSGVISADGAELDLGLETYMEDGVTYMSSDAVELCAGYAI